VTPLPRGSLYGLSFELGFVWDRELVSHLPSEEVHEIADQHRKMLKEFAEEDASRGLPWGEERVAEVLKQIQLFEDMES
jgi:hypothetical protein